MPLVSTGGGLREPAPASAALLASGHDVTLSSSLGKGVHGAGGAWAESRSVLAPAPRHSSLSRRTQSSRPTSTCRLTEAPSSLVWGLQLQGVWAGWMRPREQCAPGGMRKPAWKHGMWRASHCPEASPPLCRPHCSPHLLRATARALPHTAPLHAGWPSKRLDVLSPDRGPDRGPSVLPRAFPRRNLFFPLFHPRADDNARVSFNAQTVLFAQNSAPGDVRERKRWRWPCG